MKALNILYFILKFSIIFPLFNNNDTYLKYTNKSYFVAIGLTGEGKSLFLNTLSETNRFSTSSEGNSETQIIQDVQFNFDNNTLVAIDTPGLDDSVNNDDKIKYLRTLIYDYPTIKCLIIVKKYNNFRLSKSLQEAIKVFIDSFPLENFWDHVIIINTYANPKDESYMDYYMNERQSFLDKINKCKGLKDYMIQKGIRIPNEIKEYYVDTKQYKKNKIIEKVFTKVKMEILKMELMFKKIERSEIHIKVKKTYKDYIYLVTKYRIINCTDFNDQTKGIEEIISEEEVELTESNRIYTKKRKKYIKTDHYRWYDHSTFYITWYFRRTILYEVREISFHQVGDKIIEGKPIYIEAVWE